MGEESTIEQLRRINARLRRIEFLLLVVATLLAVEMAGLFLGFGIVLFAVLLLALDSA